MNFRERIPSFSKILPVYAVIVCCVYGFSIIRFFWRVPSLINSATMWQIGVIFSYTLVVNLVESLIIILAPIMFTICMPKKWFYDQFVAKGSLLVSLGLGYMYYIAGHINTQEEFPYPLFRLLPIVLLIIIFLVFTLTQIKFFSKALEWISEQLTVFLFISVPLSIIAVLVVLFRNLI